MSTALKEKTAGGTRTEIFIPASNIPVLTGQIIPLGCLVTIPVTADSFPLGNYL